MPHIEYVVEGNTEYMITTNDDGSSVKVIHTGYDPPVPRAITKQQFRFRFSFDERVAIAEANIASVIVARQDIDVLEYVDLDSEVVVNALNMYVIAGIITEERKREILS